MMRSPLNVKRGRMPRCYLSLVLMACVGPSDPSVDAPKTGWNYSNSEGARSTPFADGVIAVFSSASTGHVYAFDAGTGRLQWSQAVDAGPEGLGAPRSNILTFGQTIIVGAWDAVGLDRSTGAMRWRYRPSSEYAAAAELTLAGDIVLSPGSLRHLYALDAATGKERWSLDLGERPFGAVVENDVAYVPTRGLFGSSLVLGAGHLVALRVSDGSEIWRAVLPDIPNSPWRGGSTRAPALTASRVIVASNNGHVYGFHRLSGAPEWDYVGPAPYESGVAVVGNVAVAVGNSGEIIGLNAETGSVLWKASTGGSPVIAQLASDGNCIYVVTGQLSCLTSGGSAMWSIGGGDAGPRFFTSAMPAGNRIFVGSLTGFHAVFRGP
jgi:outer membrane protein assembly factor BamB